MRHLDMTTHNHASPQANEAYLGLMSIAQLAPDHPAKRREKRRASMQVNQALHKKNAQKCKNSTKVSFDSIWKGKAPNCCDPEVANHIVTNVILRRLIDLKHHRMSLD